MVRGELLAQIWDGSVQFDHENQQSPLSDLLGTIIRVPVVSLISSEKMNRPMALVEETELMDGASLGDILMEEMGLDVPQGALILVLPEGFMRATDYTGQQLGQVVGRIILDMAQIAINKDTFVASPSVDMSHPHGISLATAPVGHTRLQ